MGHGEGQRTVGTNSVIPEGAKRLSGIQKKGGYWIPDLGFASSGMTIVCISVLYYQPDWLRKVGGELIPARIV